MNIISQLLAPRDLDNSINPPSTSLIAPSISLATNGAAAIERGTIVAVDPMVVPTINLDYGKTRIISIINGKLLNTFMKRSNIAFSLGISKI